MDKAGKERLEESLRQHYRTQRETTSLDAVATLAQAMVIEDIRMQQAQNRRLNWPDFVASQVRYIPAWTWLAQVALVALMFVLASTARDVNAIRLAIGVFSAATVLVGAPTVQASKLHGVAELEYSCPRNTASVLIARLIALGCSSSFAVALMVAGTAASVDVSAFRVALWACLPFFCSCAGSLALLRRAAPDMAMVLCVAWVGACSAALLVMGHVLPGLYTQASIAAWAAAAVAALAWLFREVVQICRAAATGLDVFSPHMTRTSN